VYFKTKNVLWLKTEQCVIMPLSEYSPTPLHKEGFHTCVGVSGFFPAESHLLGSTCFGNPIKLVPLNSSVTITSMVDSSCVDWTYLLLLCTLAQCFLPFALWVMAGEGWSYSLVVIPRHSSGGGARSRVPSLAGARFSLLLLGYYWT
jgi:hypothetical protein